MNPKIDDEIGADGAKQLGEALKTNTTLTKLNLGSEMRSKGEKEW